MKNMEKPEPGENTEAQDASGQFTIKADVIEQHIMEKMDEADRAPLKRVILAGMKILFSKETSSQIFDSIRPNDQVPIEDELGAGAAHLMLILFQQSNNSMPAQYIIPAGAVLLAKACEYIHDTNMAPITDETYGEAMQMFVAVIQDKADPNYRKKLQEQGGDTSGAADSNSAPAGASPAVQAQGGLINTQGA